MADPNGNGEVAEAIDEALTLARAQLAELRESLATTVTTLERLDRKKV